MSRDTEKAETIKTNLQTSKSWAEKLKIKFTFTGQYGVTGVFGPDNSAPLTGLFYGGGTTVLMAQLVGSAIITIATFVVAYAVMFIINAAGLLRVSPEGEAHGLDLHEHGINAYPE